MGTNLPQNRGDALVWIEAHVAAWLSIADPADIGLTAAQVTEIASLTNAARASLAASGIARSESKAATQTWYDDIDAARDYAAGLVAAIKGFAESTDNAAVYTLAEIASRAEPNKKPAPPTPTGLTSTLFTDGSIELQWKNKNAEGASYLVYRQLNGAGPFVLLMNVTGDKVYRDSDVPQGATSAAYRLVAQRNGLSSPPSDTTTVYFGVPSESSAQSSGGQAESA